MLRRFRHPPHVDAPLWITAPWFAGAFVLAFAVRRGALVVLPVLAIAVFVLSAKPWIIVAAAVAYAVAVAKGLSWRLVPTTEQYWFAASLVAAFVGGVATFVRHTGETTTN